MSELPPDQPSDPPLSRGRRLRDRLWAARVLIGVALASLIVGAAGAGAVVAVAGGHERGERGGRGGDGEHGRMDHGRGFDQRGGQEDRRGRAPTPSS